MATIVSTDDNFNSLIKEHKICLVDFWAPWCTPCVTLSPHLEAIASEYPDWKILKHNLDDEPNIPTSMAVRSIPTMILFVDSVQKGVKVGATNKQDIIDFIASRI